MACICENCGKPSYDCNSRLCGRCLIEEGDDDTKRDMASGGRFYGEKLEQESEHE